MLFPMQGKPESNRCYIYKLSMQMAKQAARQQANGKAARQVGSTTNVVGMPTDGRLMAATTTTMPYKNAKKSG